MTGGVGRREKITLGILVLLLLAGGVWRASEVIRPQAGMIQTDQDESLAPEETAPQLITVHLIGAVQNPGIYHLPIGSRVYQLLDQAGGFTAEADQEAINLARPLFDGEQINIYKTGESMGTAPGPISGPAKININKATAAELTALPGIGETRAARIVDHRTKHGFFTDTRDIMDVSGIGEGIFNGIAELITIY
ncbi:MAG TPA: helix-hairpin-helix domain-containing protein [Candidatus Limnocylindrales bacterium]|nr:helix-hairpin-helix domain-containing protein [Candidatus Limnocylindrales bacterium]